MILLVVVKNEDCIYQSLIVNYLEVKFRLSFVFTVKNVSYDRVRNNNPYTYSYRLDFFQLRRLITVNDKLEFICN